METLKRMMFVLTPVLGLFTAGTAAASSIKTTYIQGGSCWSADPAVQINQFGIFNTDSVNTKRVYCPVISTFYGSTGNPPFPSNFVATMVAYDRNSNSNVACTFQTASADGSSAFFPVLQTAGNAAAAQTIVGVPNTISQYLSLYCDIPPATTSGVSVVSSFIISHSVSIPQ